MMKISSIKLKSIAGVTLIEVLVTMFIAGIAMSGMVVAYTDGLSYMRQATEKMALYNEGTSTLSMIERFIRTATYVSTGTTLGRPGHRLNTKVLVKNGNDYVEREAQFYYFPFDGSLRWNNLTGREGAFNEKLLPASNFRYRPGETPYLQVQSIDFTPIDVDRPDNSSTEGYSMIKVDLVLNDSRGDTLTLTSIMSKRNSSNY